MDSPAITLKVTELDGKKIAYSSETEFVVQVGRGAKGSYKTRWVFKGDLGKAVFYYRCINIGLGYKKRLVMPSDSRNPILSKQTTLPFMPKAKRQVKSTILARATS